MRFLFLMELVMDHIEQPRVFADCTTEQLVAYALERKEGVVAANGAFAANTGKRSGRSPRDRFIVKDETTANTVDWGVVNQPTDKARFDALWERAIAHMAEQDNFIGHYRVGQDTAVSLPVKVITEFAWHNLFAKNLFIARDKETSLPQPEWTMINAATLNTDPTRDGVNSDATLMIDMTERRVLLCGLRYAGEMKKAMFTILNHMLPALNILPMHCAANVGNEGDVALFFGLSGTGKTTLSADPLRALMGDDEHGWSDTGTFNFEGGCYAKCIHLSEEREPVIWHAIRDGAIMENVALSEAGVPDYDSAKHTQNTRAAYPRSHIDNRVATNAGGLPNAVIFLTCDLYGVLPPVSILSKEQAAYHFLSGYTALVGSTEVGSAAGITPTFSTCFGAPFFPRHATVYAELLMRQVERTGCPVYLVNTGWHGGAYGQGGERFSIPVTRAVITAILSGALKDVDTTQLPGLNLSIPSVVPGVASNLLDPRKDWVSEEAYWTAANALIELFANNFDRFDVPLVIKTAGPQVLVEHA